MLVALSLTALSPQKGVPLRHSKGHDSLMSLSIFHSMRTYTSTLAVVHLSPWCFSLEVHEPSFHTILLTVIFIRDSVRHAQCLYQEALAANQLETRPSASAVTNPTSQKSQISSSKEKTFSKKNPEASAEHPSLHCLL